MRIGLGVLVRVGVAALALVAACSSQTPGDPGSPCAPGVDDFRWCTGCSIRFGMGTPTCAQLCMPGGVWGECADCVHCAMDGGPRDAGTDAASIDHADGGTCAPAESGIAGPPGQCCDGRRIEACQAWAQSRAPGFDVASFCCAARHWMSEFG